MKKIALVLFVIVSTIANAQINEKMPPQINVTGEGKVKVVPDQAIIIVGVENVGTNAAEVKKKNDTSIDAVIKFLKSSGLPATDYQTRRVNLNRNYDFEKKKYTSFIASQTIVITLKDLAKYDNLMIGLTDAGVNSINGVEFRTSKQSQYESEARAKAVQAARGKANDYAAALGQKAGKALMVTDNTQTYYPMVRTEMYAMKADAAPQRETLAVGEIEITANVNISFQLD
jgi:uncharacterized protein